MTNKDWLKKAGLFLLRGLAGTVLSPLILAFLVIVVLVYFGKAIVNTLNFVAVGKWERP